MEDFVSKKAVKKEIMASWSIWNDENFILRRIDSMPVIDTIPVTHGRWINENPNDPLDPRMRCSICTRIETPLIKWRYCPNCGAKMENENE